MRNIVGSLFLGAAVLTGACAKSTKPATEVRSSCPVPARSAESEEKKPETYGHVPGPFDVPEMVDKDYLLIPTNPNEFEETLLSCFAAFKAAEVEGSILSQAPTKTCRTIQHVYDLQKRVVDTCKPVVYAEGFMYAKIDPEIRKRIYIVKTELKRWVAQIGEFQKKFPECFGHGEEKDKKLPVPPQYHIEETVPKILKVKSED
ncbi:hypothetical protein IT413_05975 [Candidatus Peregrinibacteria bacterium]|nr:hypothetical protein [Candidatus Peregrinibacteria bacterium]